MHRLPDLPFGNAKANVIASSEAAAEIAFAVLPTSTYTSVDKSGGFATKSFGRKIGHLGLAASASTPVHMAFGETQGWRLIIPFYGLAETKAEGRTVVLEGGRHGALAPNMQRTTEATTHSVVAAVIDFGRLCATADTLAGGDAEMYRMEERIHAIDLRRERELFPAFQQLCNMVEVTSGNAHLAQVLGIEDAFYRWTVHALALLPQESGPPLESNQCNQLDVVCDLVRSAHERAFTLTEMEGLSGLSARALQYAFKARFGCSPMEWQRRERIQLARYRLVYAPPGQTITELAYAMGFASSAAFAAQYKRYFGETPSETIRFAN